ncbi:hypothetical protein ACM39_08965 [Chryseobacterium sp. FH2]|nr:hypothetical protein ACM39_08965 [Chryseobacterium sp. FH2]
MKAQDLPSIFLDVANDNPLKTELDKAINSSARSYFKDQKAVGLSIGILLNGKAYFYNYGEMESGKKMLPANNTIYEIGSITKTFTGIALAQTVLEKKINIQDDIRKYLKGEYPNLEYKGQPIKMVNLTSHTSRITRIFPNNWERDDYIPENPFANYSREMFFEGLHHMKMDTLAGTKYEYSNMAVALLGTILEDINHQSYFTLIRKQILEPLDMKNTTIDLSKADKTMIAKSHNEKKEVVPYWDLPALPAMGALRSTTADMVKYIEANNKDFLPGMNLSHQFTFAGSEGDMGFNWFIHKTPEGVTYYEHTGGTGGARSSLQCFPQSNSGFIILTNSLANRKILEKELNKFIMKSSLKEKQQ